MHAVDMQRSLLFLPRKLNMHAIQVASSSYISCLLLQIADLEQQASIHRQSPVHVLSPNSAMPPLYIFLGGLLIISSLYTPPCSAATANGDTLAGSKALAIGNKLISRNGKFAIGFFQPGSGVSKSVYNTKTPGWYLGIWFNKIPVFTVVWVANWEKPITDPNISLTHLKISRDGNLVIINHAIEFIIWSTHITVENRTQTSIDNTSAVLLNNGNLALIA
jgi:hypothetical protein